MVHGTTLNETFIFEPTLRFFKIDRALYMVTKSNMLELVGAAPSAAALVSLESPVLWWYTTLSYSVQEINV